MNICLFILLFVATITFTFSNNNIICLLNFISIVFILSFTLFSFNYILITLLILIIYTTLLSILFLVNTLLVMNQRIYAKEASIFSLSLSADMLKTNKEY